MSITSGKPHEQLNSHMPLTVRTDKNWAK